MRKRLRIITAFLLTLAMMVSGTYAFAGTDAQAPEDENQAANGVTDELTPAGENPAAIEMTPAGEEQPTIEAAPSDEEQAAIEVTEEPVEEGVAPEAVKPKAASAPERKATVETGGEAVSLMAASGDYLYASTRTYNTTPKPGWSSYSYGTSSNDGYVVIPVKVKTSGKLWVDAQANDYNTSGATIVVGKLDETAGTVTTYSYERSGYVSPGGDPDCGIGGLDVVAGGTYCIGIRSPYYAGAIDVKAYVYSYATRTLPANKYMLASGYKTNYNDSNAQFKIKAAKTGYIRVYIKNYGFSTSSGYVTLLNTKKKALSQKLWYYSGSKTSYIRFGVRKGGIYYLKVSGAQGASKYSYHYGVMYKNYAATARLNKTKGKAKTLKRGAKYISTAMPATGAVGDHWYKFKVTKKRTTQIRIDASNIKSGKTTVTAYYGKKKIATTTLSNGQVNVLKVTYSTTYGKAKKGTYYLKLHKSATANGAYYIRYAK